MNALLAVVAIGIGSALTSSATPPPTPAPIDYHGHLGKGTAVVQGSSTRPAFTGSTKKSAQNSTDSGSNVTRNLKPNSIKSPSSPGVTAGQMAAARARAAAFRFQTAMLRVARDLNLAVCTGSGPASRGCVPGAGLNLQLIARGISLPVRQAANTAQTGGNTTTGTGRRPPASAVTPAVVEREFKSLPIKAPELHQQNDIALIWANTNFYTEPGDQRLTTTILGHRVTITATPVTYTFDYGDTTTLTTTDPGQAMNQDGYDFDTATSHVYEDTGKTHASVATTFTGSFSVDGGPERDIPGTATVTSAPLFVDVYRVKIYNVQNPCTPSSTAPGCQPFKDDPTDQGANSVDAPTSHP